MDIDLGHGWELRIRTKLGGTKILAVYNGDFRCSDDRELTPAQAQEIARTLLGPSE